MTEARIDKVSATQFDRPGDWIIHLANGETMTLAAVMRDALKLRTIETPDNSSIISRQLDTIRDQAERIYELERLNVIAHKKQRELETDIVHMHDQLELLKSDADDADKLRQQLDELRAQQAVAREECSDVIRKCNEQLAAMAATAKLRDQQVESLARLWLAAFELTGSPVGLVITRQLYRVMADHGVDVSIMPDPLTTDICDCA